MNLSETVKAHIQTEWRWKKSEQKQQATPAPNATPSTTSVQELYASLQQSRANLDVNDPVAVARFNEQVAAYNAAKASVSPPASTPIPIAAKPATPKPGKKKSEAKARES